MFHPIHRVLSFQIVAPYTLCVQFDDQTAQTINFEVVLAGQLFGPLRDLALFNEVRVDPEVHTLVWPNGADFDPATLHDWPQYIEELKARARQWELAAAIHGHDKALWATRFLLTPSPLVLQPAFKRLILLGPGLFKLMCCGNITN
jgi:hypothetical protein